MDTKVAEALFKVAKEQGWLEKLLEFFTKKHNVLMLGCSGAGKTELIKSLESLNPEVIHYSARTRDKTISGLKINKIPFRFIDLPGEVGDISIRNRAIEEHLDSIDLVINVVSHGYHEYGYGKDYAITDKYKISEDYLCSNRAREIEAIPEWSIALGGRRKFRLITVITKADLWWKDHRQVIEYYSSGEYYNSLGAAQQLTPTIMPYCSVIKKFYDEAPTSGMIDENERVRFRTNLLRTLVEAVGKGGCAT